MESDLVLIHPIPGSFYYQMIFGAPSGHSSKTDRYFYIVYYNPGLGRIFQSASPMVGYCVCNAECLHEPDLGRIRFAHRCSDPNRFGGYFPALKLRSHEVDCHAVTIPSRDEVETLAGLTVAAPL